MLEVKLSNNFVLDLILRVENSQFDELVLGSGSDRTAIIFSDDMIVKIPTYRVVSKDWLRTMKRTEEQEIEDTKKYNSCVTFHRYKDNLIIVYGEEQTKEELKIYDKIPKEIARKYGAEIYMWGKWHNHLITFSERMIPFDEDDAYNQRIIDKTREMLEEIEIELKPYPVKISDCHAANFGWDSNDNVKFVDLGWWTFPKNLASVYVDWSGFSEWAYENSNYDCCGDCDDCMYSSCQC